MNRLSICSAELISDLRQYSDRLWCDVRKVELTEANAYSAVRKFTDSDLNTGSDSAVRKFPDSLQKTGSDSVVMKFPDRDLNTGSDSVVRKFPDRDLNTGSDSAET